MQFACGYLSPYFITKADKMEAKLKDPLVCLHDGKFSELESTSPLLEAVAQNKRSLLIVADEIDSEALARLIVRQLRGELKVVAVRAPASGDHRKGVLGDIAVFTGGQVIGQAPGIGPESVTIAMLGMAGTVVVMKDKTIIHEGAGARNDIDARIVELRTQMDGAASDEDRRKLQERIAELAGG